MYVHKRYIGKQFVRNLNVARATNKMYIKMYNKKMYVPIYKKNVCLTGLMCIYRTERSTRGKNKLLYLTKKLL